MLLKTNIDKFLEIVDERGKISLGKCSKELKVDKSIIEKWGEILHESKLISLGYSFNGIFFKSVNGSGKVAKIKLSSFSPVEIRNEKAIEKIELKSKKEIEEKHFKKILRKTKVKMSNKKKRRK